MSIYQLFWFPLTVYALNPLNGNQLTQIRHFPDMFTVQCTDTVRMGETKSRLARTQTLKHEILNVKFLILMQ